MEAKIIGTRAIHDGWVGMMMAEVRLEGGETVEREIVAPPHGAGVLAYDPDRRVALLISEARPPVMQAGAAPLLEVPAGAIEDDDPEACARREAMEEGGVRLDALDHVATVWPSPGTSLERVHLYLGAYRREDRVEEGGGLPEEAEYLRVREVPLARLGRMAAEGALPDAKTLLLVQALMIRRPELFPAP